MTLGSLVVVGLALLAWTWFRALEPSALADASAAPAEADPSAVPWVFFSMVPPMAGQGAFVVEAGVLGDERPRVDITVPWMVDPGVDIARTPAVTGPTAGTVLYVADDGVASVLHRIAIAADAVPEVVAEVDAAVWSIAALPDGSAAFMALVTRGRPDQDLGVVRVALDGSGAVEPLLPPVAADRGSGFRLAAIAPFTIALDISSDGRILSRTACRGQAGCDTEYVDLATEEVYDLPGATVVDLGMSGMVIAERCHQAGCTAQLVEIETGAAVALRSHAYDTTLVEEGGRPMLVGIEGEGSQSTLVLTDPRSGARRDLYRAPEGEWLMLAPRNSPMSRPEGAVIVMRVTDAKDGSGQAHVLVPLDGAAAIELPPPAIRPVVPAGVQG